LKGKKINPQPKKAGTAKRRGALFHCKAVKGEVNRKNFFTPADQAQLNGKGETKPTQKKKNEERKKPHGLKRRKARLVGLASKRPLNVKGQGPFRIVDQGKKEPKPGQKDPDRRVRNPHKGKETPCKKELIFLKERNTKKTYKHGKRKKPRHSWKGGQ